MKCLCCDKILNDFEATRRYPSGGFVDMCNSCYRTVRYDLYTIDRPDLEDILDDLEINKGIDDD